jgi:hypothetical protein
MIVGVCVLATHSISLQPHACSKLVSPVICSASPRAQLLLAECLVLTPLLLMGLVACSAV